MLIKCIAKSKYRIKLMEKHGKGKSVMEEKRRLVTQELDLKKIKGLIQ